MCSLGRAAFLSLILLCAHLNAAQDIRIVAVGGRLAAPRADGAIAVHTGSGDAARRLPEALKQDLPGYLGACGYRVVHLDAPAGADTSAVAFIGEKRPAALIQEGAMRLAFVTSPAAIPADAHTLAVLVAAGRPEEAAAQLRAHPRIRLALVGSAGAFSPRALEAAPGRHVVLVPTDGQRQVRVELGGAAGERISVKYERLPLEPPEAVAAYLAARKIPLTPSHALIEKIPASLPPPAPPRPPPSALEPGKAAAINAACANRGMRMTIHTAALRDGYGTRKGPFLVLDVSCENIIPLTLINTRKIPTEYRAANLADHVYVLVDGWRTAQLAPKAGAISGHLPVAPFRLVALGDTLRGNLVFAMPAGAPAALELRYYDFAHGHMTCALLAGSPPARAPKTPSVKNEVVEAGIYAFEEVASFEGHLPAPGTKLVTLTVLATSRFTMEADATAFDPKAAEGDTMALGTVADWEDPLQHMQLVVDGTNAIGPLASSFPATPRFLPDVPTGGVAVFRLPENPASLELVLEFPNARLPSGEVIRPAPLRMPFLGTSPKTDASEAIVTIDDDVFRVAVLGMRAVTSFAGQTAGPGKKFLVLEFEVRNVSESREVFQTEAQLFYAAESGAQTGLDALSYKGTRPPIKLLGLAPGATRRFEAVYGIPAGDTRPRLAYQGVSKGEVAALGTLGTKAPPPTATFCPECGTKAQPGDRFCGHCGTKIE